MAKYQGLNQGEHTMSALSNSKFYNDGFRFSGSTYPDLLSGYPMQPVATVKQYMQVDRHSSLPAMSLMGRHRMFEEHIASRQPPMFRRQAPFPQMIGDQWQPQTEQQYTVPQFQQDPEHQMHHYQQHVQYHHQQQQQQQHQQQQHAQPQGQPYNFWHYNNQNPGMGGSYRMNPADGNSIDKTQDFGQSPPLDQNYWPGYTTMAPTLAPFEFSVFN